MKLTVCYTDFQQVLTHTYSEDHTWVRARNSLYIEDASGKDIAQYKWENVIFVRLAEVEA